MSLVFYNEKSRFFQKFCERFCPDLLSTFRQDLLQLTNEDHFRSEKYGSIKSGLIQMAFVADKTPSTISVNTVINDGQMKP